MKPNECPQGVFPHFNDYYVLLIVSSQWKRNLHQSVCGNEECNLILFEGDVKTTHKKLIILMLQFLKKVNKEEEIEEIETRLLMWYSGLLRLSVLYKQITDRRVPRCSCVQRD